MKNRNKGLWLVGIIWMVSILITGCSNNQDDTKMDETKQLVIAASAENTSADVQQVYWEDIVNKLIGSPLMAYGLEQEALYPACIESFDTSEDGLEITLHLDKDSQFTNGSPITADSIKRSMERYTAVSPYAEDLAPITNYVVVDDYTLILELDSPAAYMMCSLASCYSDPIDVTQAESMSDEDFARIGTSNGMFSVDKWVQGSHVELVKNPNYKTYIPFVENKGPSYLDQITVRFIPESFTRISELESGNVDIVLDVPSESVRQLEENPDIKVYNYLVGGISYLRINTVRSPLDNLSVRKAVALAMNREDLKAGLNDMVSPRYGLLSPSQLCYDEETEKSLKTELQFDLTKAKLLLKDAGYEDSDGDGFVEKDGKPLELTMLITVGNKKSAPILQSQLVDLGIKLEIREYEGEYIRQLVEEGDFDLAIEDYGWTDPDILYYMFAEQNRSEWNNPEIDALIDEARYIMDYRKRTDAYAEIQMRILEELPVVPLYTSISYMATKKNITGIVMGVDGNLFLNDVRKE